MARYFRPADDMPRIYLYRDPVDFRKAAHGLAAIVERELGHNPFDGGLYAFTNRRRNKIKCLYWEVWQRFHSSHYARFEIMHSLHTFLFMGVCEMRPFDLNLRRSLIPAPPPTTVSFAAQSGIITAPPETSKLRR